MKQRHFLENLPTFLLDMQKKVEKGTFCLSFHQVLLQTVKAIIKMAEGNGFGGRGARQMKVPLLPMENDVKKTKGAPPNQLIDLV